MIEYIALTNFFSFKERTEFSLKATKEKPRGTLSGEDWWTKVDGTTSGRSNDDYKCFIDYY